VSKAFEDGTQPRATRETRDGAAESQGAVDYARVLSQLLASEAARDDFDRVYLGNGGVGVRTEVPGAEPVKWQVTNRELGLAIDNFASQRVEAIRAVIACLRQARAAAKASDAFALNTFRRFRESEDEVDCLVGWLSARSEIGGVVESRAPDEAASAPARTGATSLAEWERVRKHILDWLAECSKVLGRSVDPVALDWLRDDIWGACSSIKSQSAKSSKRQVALRALPSEVAHVEVEPETDALELVRLHLPNLHEPRGSALREQPDPAEVERLQSLLAGLAAVVSSRLSATELKGLGALWQHASISQRTVASWSQLDDPELAFVDLFERWDQAFAALGGDAVVDRVFPKFRGSRDHLPELVRRLTLPILFAPYQGLAAAADALETERARLAHSNFSGPKWERGLTDLARGPDRAAQAALAGLLKTGAAEVASPPWQHDFINYALASKGCSVLRWEVVIGTDFSRGLYGLECDEPFIGRRTRPHSNVTNNGPEYRDRLQRRVAVLSHKIGCAFEAVERWLDEQQQNSCVDLPENRPAGVSGLDPARCDKRISYLLGHAFAGEVFSRLEGAGDEVRRLLLPVLTVPLRRQWYENGGLFDRRISWTRVHYLIRWHAWRDSDFRARIYEPLRSQEINERLRAPAASASNGDAAVPLR
jgi:hypothetical protein